MAFINNISNMILSVPITQPTGVWEKIIMAFHNGIPNYAWAIIVFTLVLKVVLLPLDFFNRRITLKNSKVQAIIQPELEKIQKQYGNNKQILNQKTMELYKKHNYNVTGSCVIMLIYMALTLFIFITLFSGLNSMAAYKVGYQYQQMENTFNNYAYSTVEIETDFEKYNSAYEIAYENKKLEIKNTAEIEKINEIIKRHENDEEIYDYETMASDEEKEEVKKAGESAVNLEENIQLMKEEGTIAGELEAGKTINDIMQIINNEVVKTYNNVKDSWLWIDNVWKSDVPWTNSLTTYDEFISLTRITYKDSFGEGEKETFYNRLSENKSEDKNKYNLIIKAIESENQVNGYLIIPILAVAVNVLSLLASQGKLKIKRKNSKESEKTTKQPGGLITVILIPALMGYITLSYNSVFSLYILISALVSLISTPLINLCIKKWDNFSENKKKKKSENISYKR